MFIVCSYSHNPISCSWNISSSDFVSSPFFSQEGKQTKHDNRAKANSILFISGVINHHKDNIITLRSLIPGQKKRDACCISLWSGKRGSDPRRRFATPRFYVTPWHFVPSPRGTVEVVRCRAGVGPDINDERQPLGLSFFWSGKRGSPAKVCV